MIRQFLTVSLVACLPALAQAEGDSAKGEKVFRKCKACHAVGEGAENKIGPVLNGIVGRQMATVDGFSYSKVLAAKGEAGDVWTAEELDAFLTKPRSYLKGTKMSYAGLRKEKDRADVLAYLATFEAE
ncbi:MAG: cytochrome c family protein [Sulfitobacter sp.]|jgi:cytochrome c